MAKRKPVDIKVSISGARELRSRFKGAGERVRNLAPAFRVIAKILDEKAGKENFRKAGTAMGGKRWKPLSRVTMMMRNQRRGYYAREPGSATGILNWTGRLAKSLRQGVGNQDHVERIGALDMEYGTRVPYAHIHEHGSPSGFIPKRPLLAMSEHFEREGIMRPIELHVVSALKPGAIRVVVEPRIFGVGRV